MYYADLEFVEMMSDIWKRKAYAFYEEDRRRALKLLSASAEIVNIFYDQTLSLNEKEAKIERLHKETDQWL